MHAAVSLRYETALRPEPLRRDDWAGGPWATLDGTFDMASIGLAYLLAYLDFRFPERHWRDRCPLLAAWYADVERRPSMVAMRPTPRPRDRTAHR